MGLGERSHRAALFNARLLSGPVEGSSLRLSDGGRDVILVRRRARLQPTDEEGRRNEGVAKGELEMPAVDPEMVVLEGVVVERASLPAYPMALKEEETMARFATTCRAGCLAMSQTGDVKHIQLQLSAGKFYSKINSPPFSPLTTTTQAWSNSK